ncbi:polysaccharide lyase [Aquimarina sp. W85]|uniref:T9SS type A sorting domain-containing protein n=1 Tax=Aquimarina rhodophyticola TaxID=3342246 RepID=UPI003672FDCE
MFTSNNRTLTAIFFLFIILDTLAQSIIYKNDFDHIRIGSINKKQSKTLLKFNSCNGCDEGLLRSIPSDRGSGNCLEVKFPKDKSTPSDSGINGKIFFDVSNSPTGEGYRELYVSFWVKFLGNFDFVKGGKIPGPGGRLNGKDMSLRLMWREEGKIEFYPHYNTQINQQTRIWWNNQPVGQVKFNRNKWHHIEMHYKLNTLGNDDGIMEGWIDGIKAAGFYNVDDFIVSSDDVGLLMNHFYFSTFFGGSSNSSWWANNDELVLFDDFVVATGRIGYDSIIDEVDINLPPIVSFTTPVSNLFVKEGYNLRVNVDAEDPDGSIAEVTLYLDDTFVRKDNQAPYEWGDSNSSNPNELNGLSSGTYTVKAVAIDNKGAITQKTFNLIVTSNNDNDNTQDCSFATPIISGIPAMDNVSYTNVHVLGNNGPNLDNLREFSINWDPFNDSLHKFAVKTKDGFPRWYISFVETMSFQLKNANPEITLTNTGVAGLDGAYWVAKDDDNFILVSKSREFSLYFNNSLTAPSCLSKSSKTSLVDELNLIVHPNPVKNVLHISNTFSTIDKVNIYDFQGKEIITKRINKEQFQTELNVQNLEAGLYFLKVYFTDKKTLKTKFIKEI